LSTRSILGNHYAGQYDPVLETGLALEAINAKNGWQVRPRPPCAAPPPSRIVACTRYSSTSKLYCGSQASFYCPLPTCKAYPIAILLHDHWAIYALLPTPLMYAVNHTILVMAISCKGQLAAVVLLSFWRLTRLCASGWDPRRRGVGRLHRSLPDGSGALRLPRPHSPLHQRVRVSKRFGL